MITRKRILLGIAVLVVGIGLIFATGYGVTSHKKAVKKHITIKVEPGEVNDIYVGSLEVKSENARILNVSVEGVPQYVKVLVKKNSERDVSVMFNPQKTFVGNVTVLVSTSSGTRKRFVVPVSIVVPNVSVRAVAYENVTFGEGYLKAFSDRPSIIYEVSSVPKGNLVNVTVLSGNAVAKKINGTSFKLTLFLGKDDYSTLERIKLEINMSFNGRTANIVKEVDVKTIALYIEGINTPNALTPVRPFLHYYDPETGTNVYAFRVLSNVNSTVLIKSEENVSIASYPFFYGEFPECWKAIGFTEYQYLFIQSGSGGSQSGGCGLTVPTGKETLVYPMVTSVVYVLSRKPLSNVTLDVMSKSGFVAQRITLGSNEFQTTDLFPTFGVESVFNSVANTLPIVVSSSSDGFAFTPIYLRMAGKYVISPIPSDLPYKVRVYAILPDREKNVSMKLNVPAMNVSEYARLKPVAEVNGKYYVYESEFSFESPVVGVIPADLITFVSGKPVLFERTFITFTNAEQGSKIPSISIGGKVVGIDYNALELIKFWGYAVGLMKSNETLLQRGGYISKSDGSITLRLENINLHKEGAGVVSAYPRPYKLYNITLALKIMFLGKPTSLDAVGMYVSPPASETGEVLNATPLSITLQPKYAFMNEVAKTPEKYVGIQNTYIGGREYVIVDNPTPYPVVVFTDGGTRTVEPFSFGLFDRVGRAEIIVNEHENRSVIFDGTAVPLRFVPNNRTVERVLGENAIPVGVTMNYTVIEIPFTIGNFGEVKKVSVVLDGKEHTAREANIQDAELSIKNYIVAGKSEYTYYWTVFNGRLVLNVVVPLKKAEDIGVKIITANGREYTVIYKGRTAKVIERLGCFDIAPIPNFNAYTVTGFEPIVFDPIENPYRTG